MVMIHSRPPHVLLQLMSHHPGYPCTARCEHQAAPQRGIEAEAILQSSLQHTPVDWGCRRETAQRCLGAEYAKHARSLNNLDAGNSLIRAMHYLSVCAYIVFYLDY